jgi:hypothetical protein
VGRGEEGGGGGGGGGAEEAGDSGLVLGRTETRKRGTGRKMEDGRRDFAVIFWGYLFNPSFSVEETEPDNCSFTNCCTFLFRTDYLSYNKRCDILKIF